MPTPESTGQPRGARAGVTPSQVLELLRRATLARAMPLLHQVQAASETELRARQAAEPSRALEDALTQLGILRHHAMLYERRWQENLARAFDGWPKPAAVAATAAYALVSDDELQSQLVGQPVVETLERRFVDILDVIDSRLWSLAAALGGQARPLNPVAPRALVEGFLATFPASECERELRGTMLRHFERAVADGFGDFYSAFNQQLSEAGFAMSRASDYAMLMASTLGGIAAPTESAIDGSYDNAIAAHDASWRNKGGQAQRRDQLGAVRGMRLRERLRALREAGSEVPSQARVLRDEEFLAVLSLLQGDGEDWRAARRRGTGAHLRARLQEGAAGLGMDRASTRLDLAQEDAIDVVGALFDALFAAHALDDAAQVRLCGLVYPYLRLAMAEPSLFEPPEHPALQLLSAVVEALDANPGADEHDAGLQAIAARAIGQVVEEYHGDARVFERVAASVREELDAREKRVEIAVRRAAQSILGRERLQAARRAADRALFERAAAVPLLPSVAQFLADAWRQSLIQAWLRDDGTESQRFVDALALGDAMLRIDRDAADAQGHRVAEGLLAIEQPLRDCYVACGIDESGARDMLAMLVAEISRPDASRAVREFTPLAEDADGAESRAAGADAVADIDAAVGQAFVAMDAGLPAQRLRVAWRSPHSGRILLVNRQGARQHLLSQAELAREIARGALAARDPAGPVEAAIARLSGAGDAV